MTISIINKDINTFHENGFLLKRSFFSADKCGSLIKELEDYDKSKIINTKEIRSTFLKNRIDNKIPFGGLTYLQKADRACPLIKSFMNKELLKACSKLLMKDDIFFKDNEIHIRQANTSHIIPAHQDNFYFCLKNGLALTCYVYLTEQKRTSGGLGFLKSNTNSRTIKHERSSIEGFSSFNNENPSIELLSCFIVRELVFDFKT